MTATVQFTIPVEVEVRPDMLRDGWSPADSREALLSIAREKLMTMHLAKLEEHSNILECSDPEVMEQEDDDES